MLARHNEFRFSIYCFGGADFFFDGAGAGLGAKVRT